MTTLHPLPAIIQGDAACRCGAQALAHNLLCQDCDDADNKLRASLQVEFDPFAGPQFGWRGLWLQVDAECLVLIDAHVDDTLDFADRFGLPVTNEHAREVAAEAVREQTKDLLLAWGHAEADWVRKYGREDY